MSTKFGSALRAARAAASVTMGDLADHLGISVPIVSDVELGKRRPFQPERIGQVAAFLGADEEELLEAATESRGHFELTVDLRPEAQRVGVALQRAWGELSEEQLARIESILAGKGDEDESKVPG